MFRLRLAILGAAAVLALGVSSALAMTETASGLDSDSHGDAVASAARNCPHGASGVHGACVSAIASENGQDHRNGQNGNRNGQQSDSVAACKAKDMAEDGAEKPGSKGAGRTEDMAEQMAFVACIHGGATTG